MTNNRVEITGCTLEVHEDRGVIYVHASTGITLLRICGCPKGKFPLAFGKMADITLKFETMKPGTFNWREAKDER